MQVRAYSRYELRVKSPLRAGVNGPNRFVINAWATIFDISHQSIPGFKPLAMQRPHHYLPTVVLYFYMKVEQTDFVE